MAGGSAAAGKQERAELVSVLKSDLFRRSQNLSRILSYLCEKVFQGESDHIKEYTIAVEVLARPPDFDPKADPIIRVEVHHIRKRLEQYYAGEGAGHSIRIVLPKGQYVPVFMGGEEAYGRVKEPARSQVDRAENPATAPTDGDSLGLRSPVASPRRGWWGVAIVFSGVGLAWILTTILAPKPFATRLATAPATNRTQPLAPTALRDEVRIRAGAEQSYVDSLGYTWFPDQFFKWGVVRELKGQPISATRDPTIFWTRREGNFQYNIPLEQGTYELHLLFADNSYAEGTRARVGGDDNCIMNVRINGRHLIRRMDVADAAGAPNAAFERVFRDIQPAADGFLHLEFSGLSGPAFLNGIKILRMAPGQPRPVRIVARPYSYIDKDHRQWDPDHYFSGGLLVARTNVVRGADDPLLYRGERYGEFTCAVPVADGSYQVRLHFAETWFGLSNPGKGGVGSRVFHVFCNGVHLLKDFDILREAGGENIALVKTFHRLTPNSHGKLLLTFVPTRNRACVNAIEVLPEP